MMYESDNPQFDNLINNLNDDSVPYRATASRNRPGVGMGGSSDDTILAGVMRRLLEKEYVELYDDGEFTIEARIYVSEIERRVIEKQKAS